MCTFDFLVYPLFPWFFPLVACAPLRATRGKEEGGGIKEGKAAAGGRSKSRRGWLKDHEKEEERL